MAFSAPVSSKSICPSLHVCEWLWLWSVSPIAFITENIIDIIVLVVFSLVVWVFAWTKEKLNKGEGALMLLLYVAYAVYIVIR